MDTKPSAGANCQTTMLFQTNNISTIMKQEPSCPEAPSQITRERQNLKRLVVDTEASISFQPGSLGRVDPTYNKLDNAKKVKNKKNPKLQSVPFAEVAKGFNTYSNPSPGVDIVPFFQSPIHGNGFMSPRADMVSEQVVNNLQPFSPFGYPPVGSSPQQNRLLSSGLLNYSLLSSKPGILGYSYLTSLFDMNPSLDAKARAHLESLIDISRYDQPELFQILSNTRNHSRQLSSHDVDSTAGEFGTAPGTAPGSPLYPAHLHWDLCQRPVSSPNFHKIEVNNQMVPLPLYQNFGPYINNPTAMQRSTLPISQSCYLPTSLIQNSFEPNLNHENTNYSEKVLPKLEFNNHDSNFPKLKPKPCSAESRLNNSLDKSDLNSKSTSTSSQKNPKKGNSISISLHKHNQIPLATKSAWGCLYTVRKDGKPSTRATKMRLSEALALIESHQVTVAFNNAGHSTPTVCPYPRCEVAFNSDFDFLNQHILTHNPDRPFECSICNVAFQRDQDLSRHKNIHLQIKAFTCPHCQKNFGRRDAQQRHTLKKTCLSSSNLDDANDLESQPVPPKDS